MNLYLVFFLGYIQPNALSSFLNSRQEIRNWYSFGSVLSIVSTASVTEIQNILLQLFYSQSFVVTPIYGPYTGGNMPKQFWEFINNPTDSGYWPAIPQQQPPQQ
ncbi:MAG: hypothetical protein K6G15_00015 [Desulfovibrio sp.]|nr:hypothetical protein [Desulfovibrio sp.]